MAQPPHLDLTHYDAALFDLDGVLTATAALHAECWKRAFDGLFAEHAQEPFDLERDYVAHVDGKPRRDGARDLLRARGLDAGDEQVGVVADRKQALVERALAAGGVEAYPGSLRWVRHLREAGVRTAVVSSSTNAHDVLRAAGIDGLFEVVVDGGVLEALELNGKPAPDGFLEAAARLGVSPARAVVVEDALAGVTAGAAGAFGLVVGVARTAESADLRRAGANIVVADLEELIPVEPPWQIVERCLDPERMAAQESVFAVGNGYLGIRGAPEEGAPSHDPGVILNGLHETWPILYPEDAHGLARVGQTIVNATDGSIIRLFIDDEPLDLSGAGLTRFERVLDLSTGVLSREVEWETPRGGRVLIRSRRLASLEDRHLGAMDYEVVALDEHVRIAICSELVTHAPGETADDPRRGKGFAEKVLVPVTACADGARAVLQLATRSSGLHMACGMEHHVDSASAVTVETTAEGDGARVVVLAELEPGASLRLSKFVAYHWAAQAPAGDLAARVDRTLDRARGQGYGAIEEQHRRHVAAFWRRSDIELSGAPDLQRSVRFNLFQLLQATARSEGLGVPAKGVTGRGYEGHYFWDTEIYVVPFLVHTDPRRAKQVLSFRCGMLDAARERARQVGHAGALYPWRTITGQEASAWYAAGTAQYHINADIAYALRHYTWVTGDLGFVLDQGAEVMIETARLWMDLGFFSDRRDGRFCINGVTGPDEYTSVVDNNAYTNLMAKENLEGAVRVLDWLAGQDPQAHAALMRSTALTVAEIASWRRAAEHMYVPRHEQLGIVLQDEHFLDRERWDFAGTPAEKHPLLLHYHPLELYRHQVIKQTDVVLATYLVEHNFSEEETRRTFDYYDPLTTGDSTLSACVQSVIASAVGYAEPALRYFKDACAVDLLDTHGNTADGIHVASCGGTWLALVAGFGGLRDFDGELRFQPRLPSEWERLRFRVQARGQLVEVDMTQEATTYRLLEGRGILVRHFGDVVRLTPATPVRRPTAPLQVLPRAA
jgi:alpha,alpha-trehalose phosphorylase